MAVFPPNDSRNDLYPYMRDYTAFLKKMERPLVGRQKEMAQLMAAMSRPELCNAILLAEAGSGKACDAETPLPVADGRGYIRLGDVRSGDYVFDESGRPVKVLRVFPQGRIPAYRVGFMDGSEIVCNDEHLWAVRSMEDAMAGTPYRTVSLADIMREGVDRGPASSHMVPLAGAVEREPVQLPMDPYDMGMALGQDVVSLYRDAVLDGRVLRGSVEQRRRFLHGLMDRAGAVDAVHYMGAMFPGVRIDVPVGVSRAVRTLCASLGYRSHARGIGGDVVRIELLISWEEARGLFTREVEGLSDRWEAGLPACGGVAIRFVEPLGEDREMLCIYVDGPSHLFQIGYDHIVTHNTALVQGTMVKDTARAYLEVDLPKMISNLKNENEMADKLKQLFREVEAFRKAENKEIVLFIDEFHQIVQLSPAAVEVLKPLLADSGTRGIRVIAATTYIEFQEYIASNLPLVERLQRINLNAPDEDTVVSILRGMAERYGVKSQFPNDSMFHSIYEYTNRYIPSTAQPRKSILMLDSMIGWHRFTKKPMDMKMLADVIYDTEGVNIAFRVNAGEIKKELDKVVLSQDFATSAIEGRLQICVADLNNKNRPMSSFLFTGSTGTGKTETTKQLCRILFQDDRALVRMDMTEYALPESLERFRQELTTAVWTRPYCILLLDEIEKACAPVTRILLQVLDDGRLLDRHNREVTFKNAYIIITTNAGSEIYKTIAQYGVDDTGSGKLMEKYESLIRDSIKGTTGGGKFPPELLGRIDCLVPFQPLSEKTMANICEMKLKKLAKEVYDKHHITVQFDQKIIRYIVQDKMTTDSDAGGARGVVSRIEREVTIAVSRFINEHQDFRSGRTIFVCVEGNLAVDNKFQLETDGRVVVRDTPPEGGKGALI